MNAAHHETSFLRTVWRPAVWGPLIRLFLIVSLIVIALARVALFFAWAGLVWILLMLLFCAALLTVTLPTITVLTALILAPFKRLQQETISWSDSVKPASNAATLLMLIACSLTLGYGLVILATAAEPRVSPADSEATSDIAPSLRSIAWPPTSLTANDRPALLGRVWGGWPSCKKGKVLVLEGRTRVANAHYAVPRCRRAASISEAAFVINFQPMREETLGWYVTQSNAKEVFREPVRDAPVEVEVLDRLSGILHVRRFRGEIELLPEIVQNVWRPSTKIPAVKSALRKADTWLGVQPYLEAPEWRWRPEQLIFTASGRAQLPQAIRQLNKP
jgi:hypothetical protein